jgi:hypothetical protein
MPRLRDKSNVAASQMSRDRRRARPGTVVLTAVILLGVFASARSLRPAVVENVRKPGKGAKTFPDPPQRAPAGVPAGCPQTTAASSAFGESVSLNVAPGVGGAVTITSGPLPTVSGSAPPPYNSSNTVLSVTVSHGLTGQILSTGVLTVNASSTVPASEHVDAQATVDSVDIDIGTLLTLDATSVSSSAEIEGPCGTLASSPTAVIVNGVLGGTLVPGGLTIPVNPAPNTVFLDTAGVRVVLNEQFVGGDGIITETSTVNAIHIFLTNVSLGNLVVNGDLVISSSQAEVCCGPATPTTTSTSTATQTETNTPVTTSTGTPTSTPTSTQTPTRTPTPTVTQTAAPGPATETATPSPPPTVSSTPTPMASSTATPTDTPTIPGVTTPTATPTFGAASPTPTPSFVAPTEPPGPDSAEIPTLSFSMLVVLGMALAGFGLLFARRS